MCGSAEVFLPFLCGTNAREDFVYLSPGWNTIV